MSVVILLTEARSVTRNLMTSRLSKRNNPPYVSNRVSPLSNLKVSTFFSDGILGADYEFDVFFFYYTVI